MTCTKQRFRSCVAIGLALLMLAAAQTAFGASPKPPVTSSAAASQYAPPQAALLVTARAREVGMCKRAVTKTYAVKAKECKKNAKCRTKVQRDEFLAKRQCDKLILPQ